MTGSLPQWLSAEARATIKANFELDQSQPYGIRWKRKHRGRQSAPGKTVWVGYQSFRSAQVVLILNNRLPEEGQIVATRVDINGSWANVENLKWATQSEAFRCAREQRRMNLLRDVFGAAIPDVGNKRRLAKLCRKKHAWNGKPVTLQILEGQGWRCIECARENAKEKRCSEDYRERERKRYQAMTDERKQRVRERARNRARLVRQVDPEEYNKKKREYKRQRNRTLAGLGLTSKGSPVKSPTIQAVALASATYGQDMVGYLKALRCPQIYKSVARLVMDEQRRYWREHPEAKREHDKQWDRDNWWLQYQINPDLRLYVRQKSKRRKALLREQTAHQIKPRVIRARFAQFNNCCAYCGAAGDMQIEHVVPISRGGTHAIGNIVPACQTCNYSKRDHEVEWWYRAQPQFSEKRWRKICQVLGWDRSGVGQLALL